MLMSRLQFTLIQENKWRCMTSLRHRRSFFFLSFFFDDSEILSISFRHPSSLFPKYDYDKIYADCEPYHGESIILLLRCVTRADKGPIFQVAMHMHTITMVSMERRELLS